MWAKQKVPISRHTAANFLKEEIVNAILILPIFPKMRVLWKKLNLKPAANENIANFSVVQGLISGC